jgi:hypothetical protein
MMSLLTELEIICGNFLQISRAYGAVAKGADGQFLFLFPFSIRLHLLGVESCPEQSGWPENSS